MRKAIILTLLSFLSINSFASKRYVYKARVLLALSAKLVIDVSEETYNGEKVLKIKSNSKVHAFGKEIANLDYIGLNDEQTFSPKLNLECEHSSNQSSKNCRSVKFLEYGQFLYREFHSSVTRIRDFSLGDTFVTSERIEDQQPTFNSNENQIFDLASIALLVKFLKIDKYQKNQDLFIAINRSMAKIRVSHVKDLPGNKMWIKLMPISPAASEFKISFPHKIIYDKNLKAVTEIHQKLPIVGNVKIKLDLRASRL